MSATTALYLSDNTLTATLTDEDGAAVTGGTGTVTIVDADGTEVAGVSWPQSLEEPSPADGTYTYDIPYNVLTNGESYVAKVTFTAPGNRYVERTIQCVTDQD